MASLHDFVNLDLSDTTEKIIAEYIWVGGSGMDMRSKARTLPGPVTNPSELPKWNYDGSSTNQAPGDDSEVILYPRAIFKDPFRKGNNILVICDSYTPAGEPIPTNKRAKAAEIFSNPDVEAEEPWFGIEQEYTLLTMSKWPLGWPENGYPGPQGPYYCGNGADKAFGRDIVDAHYKACLYAGINISGINGIDVINAAIEKLEARHTEHIAAYGEGNERRLTGNHETASINQFTWGVANRGASVRIGRDTEKQGKGYFEDRRPASNMDPYVVTSMIAETTILPAA
ncbi:unnamed protein product [Linum tenue]|uniref:glutamine synthetase n=1 Tax=Linum tenue TaxID=586396 RepID=A0AAV0K2F3_9ROSI|nr:unnamed protein product [Linum tenue]